MNVLTILFFFLLLAGPLSSADNFVEWEDSNGIRMPIICRENTFGDIICTYFNNEEIICKEGLLEDIVCSRSGKVQMICRWTNRFGNIMCILPNFERTICRKTILGSWECR